MNLYKYLEDNIDETKIQEFKNDEYELAIVRYVLKETSKLFYRDSYFFLNREEIKKRRSIYSKKIDANNIEVFEIVCSSYCNLLKEVLGNKYNIKTEVITTDYDIFKHVALLLITKNENRYFIDPIVDLTTMKVGMETQNFASKENKDNSYVKIKIENLKFLDKEILKKIDEKIGYLTNNDYLDNYIYKLHEKLKNISNLQKESKTIKKLIGRNIKEYECRDITIFKIICFFEIIKKNIMIKGIVDLMIFIKSALNILLEDEEQSKIKIVDFWVDNYDLKDNEILEILSSSENRKRGLVIECNNQCIIFSIFNEKYLILCKEKWKEKVIKNNIFVREKSNTTLYNYLYKLDMESCLIKHKEFIKILEKFERNIIDEGMNPEDFIKIINREKLCINYNISLEFSIEDDELVMFDKTNNKKISIEVTNEGRNVNYNVIN